MANVRVVVAGPNGKMGSVLLRGLGEQPGLEVVGGLARDDPSAAALLARGDVLVDFTNAESAPRLLLQAIEAGVRPVSGTSGMPEAAFAAIDAAARKKGIGAIWAANYRVAAVLAAHFARIAARHLDAVEIVEMYPAGKADSPSGSALSVARGMREVRGEDFTDPPVQHLVREGARGALESSVRIHSLRSPADVSRHELIFSSEEDVLTVRHDGLGRAIYPKTVARAIAYVMRPEIVGLVRGYEQVIGLTDERSR